MRHFFWTPLFWGLVIILSGVLVIIKSVFHIDLPIWRILIAIILILVGISLLMGWRARRNRRIDKDGETTVLFSDERLESEPVKKEYNVVFGHSRIDLRQDNLEDVGRVEVNAIFSSVVISIPADVAIEIEANTAFGSTKLPGAADSGGFGEIIWLSRAAREGADPVVHLETNAVFGSLDILEL